LVLIKKQPELPEKGKATAIKGNTGSV